MEMADNRGISDSHMWDADQSERNMNGESRIKDHYESRQNPDRDDAGYEGDNRNYDSRSRYHRRGDYPRHAETGNRAGHHSYKSDHRRHGSDSKENENHHHYKSRGESPGYHHQHPRHWRREDRYPDRDENSHYAERSRVPHRHSDMNARRNRRHPSYHRSKGDYGSHSNQYDFPQPSYNSRGMGHAGRRGFPYNRRGSRSPPRYRNDRHYSQRYRRRSRSPMRRMRSHSGSFGRRSYSPRRRSLSYRPPSPLRHTLEIEITSDDASFILGVGSKTKRKLCRVSCCDMNVINRENQTVLEIRSNSQENIDKAKFYVSLVMQQRIGPVTCDVSASERDDMTILYVPSESVGYITGQRGRGLRAIEEEWGTLMFFSELNINKHKEYEKLIIFGTEVNRKGSELKAMSAIEQKSPGYYTKDVEPKVSDFDGFDTDIVELSKDDYSYALGKKGATRKKLSRASRSIIEYIGPFAFIAGSKHERTMGREYLTWLRKQRNSPVYVKPDRPDLCVMNIPTEAIAFVTGKKGSCLRRIEDQTDSFIFLNAEKDGKRNDLLIFGYDESNRQHACKLIQKRMDQRSQYPMRRSYSMDRR